MKRNHFRGGHAICEVQGREAVGDLSGWHSTDAVEKPGDRCLGGRMTQEISSSQALPRRRVTRLQIVARGLAHRCPNCGEGRIFAKGDYFSPARACPSCGMRWDKDEAAFLGSVTLNYGVTVFGLVIPWIVIALMKDVSAAKTAAVAILAALVVPVLLYRPSKSWWFMCYYLFLPDHLPANWRERAEGELPPDE